MSITLSYLGVALELRLGPSIVLRIVIKEYFGTHNRWCFFSIFGNNRHTNTVELTTFNAHQRVSTHVKISPHAERTLSRFVIV